MPDDTAVPNSESPPDEGKAKSGSQADLLGQDAVTSMSTRKKALDPEDDATWFAVLMRGAGKPKRKKRRGRLALGVLDEEYEFEDRPGFFDFRPCKKFAAKSYPVGNALREAMLSEPDFIPVEEALGKLPAYLRMIFAMRGKTTS
jgi:hypothetical protein